MISSYEKHNFGELFKKTVTDLRPQKIVEFGVLHGYSTSYLAEGLKINKKYFKVDGHLDAYDLWDDYPYKHGNMYEVQEMLRKKRLTKFVTLKKGDIFQVYVNYNKEIAMLHVDISNTGETLRKVMELWNDKIIDGGTILFEGGSKERDEIEWMKKYNKELIRPELYNNAIIKEHYTFVVHEKFPSLTILHKEH